MEIGGSIGEGVRKIMEKGRKSIYWRTYTFLPVALAMVAFFTLRYAKIAHNIWRPTSPVLSVVIPCYNCERWLDETMASLLRQSFQNFSVIFVDDGSTHPVRFETIRKLYPGGDLRLVRHRKNMGLPAARNTGVMLAKDSRFVIFLDPDDLIEPTALEKLLIRMTNEADNCAFVYPGAVHFRPDDPKRDIVRQAYSEDALFKRNYIPSFALIRRDVYVAAGGMCEAYIKYWEDQDFWQRLANLQQQGALMPEPVFWYRRHPQGRSSKIYKAVDRAAWERELLINNPRNLPDYDDETLTLHEEEFVIPPCYYQMDTSAVNVLSRISDLAHLIKGMMSKPERTSSFKAMRELRGRDRNFTLDHLSLQMRPKKESVLMIIPWMQIGGADTYDLDMINILSKTYHIVMATEIDLEVHQNQGAFQKFTQDIFQLPALIEYPHHEYDLEMSRMLEYLVRTRNVKHVYCRNSMFGYRFFQYTHETGLKRDRSITTYDVQHVFITRDKGGWEHTTVPYHEFIDKRIVISQNMLDRQLEILGDGSDEKFTTIPPSVDLSFWGGNALCANSIGKTVLFVGRVDEQKDPFKWVRVAKILAKVDPELKFVVVGEGPLLPQMQIDASDLGDSIEFSNRFMSSEEIVRVMAYGSLNDSKCRESILLMTSEFEGVPMVILEALAAGVHVVAPIVGAIPEIASAAGGLTFSPSRSDEDFAWAVNQLLNPPLSAPRPNHVCNLAFGEAFGRESFSRKISHLFS